MVGTIEEAIEKSKKMKNKMSFNFQIISPEKAIFDEDIEMVIIPGKEGDMGILNNHMPLITSLRLGNVHIYRNKKIVKKFLINGGILEVTGNKCTYLPKIYRILRMNH